MGSGLDSVREAPRGMCNIGHATLNPDGTTCDMLSEMVFWNEELFGRSYDVEFCVCNDPDFTGWMLVVLSPPGQETNDGRGS